MRSQLFEISRRSGIYGMETYGGHMKSFVRHPSCPTFFGEVGYGVQAYGGHMKPFDPRPSCPNVSDRWNRGKVALYTRIK